MCQLAWGFVCCITVLACSCASCCMVKIFTAEPDGDMYLVYGAAYCFLWNNFYALLLVKKVFLLSFYHIIARPVHLWMVSRMVGRIENVRKLLICSNIPSFMFGRQELYGDILNGFIWKQTAFMVLNKCSRAPLFCKWWRVPLICLLGRILQCALNFRHVMVHHHIEINSCSHFLRIELHILCLIWYSPLFCLEKFISCVPQIVCSYTSIYKLSIIVPLFVYLYYTLNFVVMWYLTELVNE